MPINCEGSCFSFKLLQQLLLLFPVDWDTHKCLMPQACFDLKQLHLYVVRLKQIDWH